MRQERRIDEQRLVRRRRCIDKASIRYRNREGKRVRRKKSGVRTWRRRKRERERERERGRACWAISNANNQAPRVGFSSSTGYQHYRLCTPLGFFLPSRFSRPALRTVPVRSIGDSSNLAGGTFGGSSSWKDSNLRSIDCCASSPTYTYILDEICIIRVRAGEIFLS